MDIVKSLEGFLFEISTGLYGPVVAGVSALVIYVFLIAGIFVADLLLRWRIGSADLRSFRLRLDNEVRSSEPYLDARLERLLQETELALSGRLDRVRFVIKVGPAVGLMGTLIPMGISLAALAEGNIPKMAGSMVTAFTATVAGLGCSVVSYLVALVREQWVRSDVREMEFLTEVCARDASAPPINGTSGQGEGTDAVSTTPAAT